jgi:hypothetical protein
MGRLQPSLLGTHSRRQFCMSADPFSASGGENEKAEKLVAKVIE